ncbi:DUF2975 domain-containing protein [Marinicauda salina]|jgi:hypothetical protein|uniref:DUF2975 domain-containing protein n=1 Tax=Marinicauda salina TaxID=2135793 RepID=A0A2U2BWP5_9PROT|nr:DUF2975 domain-containing protein [Marinicauda salina]PWE18394.1 DUF2975 domain-containing protein [Marinicauda salina]
MRTLGPGSLASILKLLLDILIYGLWALLGLTSLIMILMMFAGLYRLTGIGPELPGALLQFLKMDVALALPLAIAAIIALTFIVDRLRRIFATLIAGDPFVPENAGHLRAIAIAIAIYQLIRYAAQGVIALVFTFFGRSVEGGASLEPGFTLNLGAWFAVLTLFVLSEVFREGARLREEQKLTI